MAVKQTFIDTLFVIALINRRDQYHAQADELALLYEDQPLLTTDAVGPSTFTSLALIKNGAW